MLADIGRDGPHPNLVPDMVREMEMLKPERRVIRASVRVLQQRTIAGLPRPFDLEGDETISIVLAVSPASGGPGDLDHLVAYIARRADGEEEWKPAGSIYKPFRPDQGKPWTGSITIDARQGLASGALIHEPQIELLQIELPDGVVYEDRAANGSVLLYVPLRSPDRWAGEAIIRTLGHDGRTIESTAIPLDPRPPGG